MKSIKPILVPFNFTPYSVRALAYAIDLAAQANAVVHLLYVLEASDMISEIFVSETEREKMEQDALARLRTEADKVCNQCNIKVELLVKRGKPYRVILDHATATEPRYIVQGANDTDNCQDNVLGSNALNVIRASLFPVLTIQGEKKTLGNKFVVPLDLTKETRWQVFNAIALAMLKKAEIHLVSGVVGGISVLKSRIFFKIKRVKYTIEENDIACYIKVYGRSDVPVYKKVLEYVKEIDADAIFLLTRQESALHDNYVGAFAYHIIRESSVPVITMTSQAAEPDTSSFVKQFVDPMGVLFRRRFRWFGLR